MTQRRRTFAFTQALSNKLRYRITRYFRAYYKTLRREVEKAVDSGTEPDSIPHYYRGRKKVQTILCRDGVLILHLPADEGTERDLEERRDLVVRFALRVGKVQWLSFAAGSQ